MILINKPLDNTVMTLVKLHSQDQDAYECANRRLFQLSRLVRVSR